MSEYRWYVKNMWCGVEGPEPELRMLGIIKRSGWCHAIGHFCHVKVNVNGKAVWASGAEDRIFPFHHVQWKDIGEKAPKDMVRALGWCLDKNTYAFLYEDNVVIPAGEGTWQNVPRDLWQPDWSDKETKSSEVPR